MFLSNVPTGWLRQWTAVVAEGPMGCIGVSHQKPCEWPPTA